MSTHKTRLTIKFRSAFLFTVIVIVITISTKEFI